MLRSLRLALILVVASAILPLCSSFHANLPLSRSHAKSTIIPMWCSQKASDSQDGKEEDFADKHVDKRGVTGRFSAFAEGLDANDLSEKEFRDMLRERMMERRKNSLGSKASSDYMDFLSGKKPPADDTPSS